MRRLRAAASPTFPPGTEGHATSDATQARQALAQAVGGVAAQSGGSGKAAPKKPVTPPQNVAALVEAQTMRSASPEAGGGGTTAGRSDASSAALARAIKAVEAGAGAPASKPGKAAGPSPQVSATAAAQAKRSGVPGASGAPSETGRDDQASTEKTSAGAARPVKSKLFEQYAHRIRAIADAGRKERDPLRLAKGSALAQAGPDLESGHGERPDAIQGRRAKGGGSPPVAAESRPARPGPTPQGAPPAGPVVRKSVVPAPESALSPQGGGVAGVGASIGAVSTKAGWQLGGGAVAAEEAGSASAAGAQEGRAGSVPRDRREAQGATGSDVRRLEQAADRLLLEARELSARGAGPKSRQLEEEAAHLLRLANAAGEQTVQGAP